MRLLIIATSVLLAGQAQAVDYVKCDAIQKAYGRVIAEQKQVGAAAYEAKQQELCGFDYGCRIKEENGVLLNHAKAYEAREAAEASFKEKLDAIKADNKKEGCP
jgi:hypothetical protein